MGAMTTLPWGRPITRADLRTYIAPLDVVLADDTVLQPDVLVARRADLTDRDLPAPPVLAVEVMSPSTRRIDGLLKPARYASSGVHHYWLVDPGEPSLTAYELGVEGYHVVTVVRGIETFAAERPFAVSVTPGDLVGDA